MLFWPQSFRPEAQTDSARHHFSFQRHQPTFEVCHPPLVVRQVQMSTLISLVYLILPTANAQPQAVRLQLRLLRRVKGGGPPGLLENQAFRPFLAEG